jgi:hypothetical protein
MLKNFSTSSSSQIKNKSSAKLYLVVYVSTLLFVFIATLLPAFLSLPSLTWRDLDAINYGGLINSPPDSDWYLASDFKGPLDHDVLYYNFGKSIENAKKADILFLGNSRVQLGLDRGLLESFAKRNCLNYFNMAFANVESYQFPLMIIRKYDLRPKVIIINAEDFTGSLSFLAQDVISQGRLQSVLLFFLRNATYKDILVLHSYAPRWIRETFSATLKEHVYKHVVYRSRVTGQWSRPASRKSIPITNKNESDCEAGIKEKTFDNAKRFKEEMSKRGTRVVLTLVPHNYSSQNCAEQLAKHIGALMIGVDWHGLSTVDLSHLTKESSQRFTEEFLRKFETSECFLDLIYKKNHQPLDY